MAETTLLMRKSLRIGQGPRPVRRERFITSKGHVISWGG